MRDTCGECESKNAADAKAKHMAGLAALTIEQRVAKIEEQLYDGPSILERFDPNEPIG